MLTVSAFVAGDGKIDLQYCGKWRLDREIGHGAYGVVYAAADKKGNRAAVKVCRRDAVGDERYKRELRGAKLYYSIPSQEGLVRMKGFGLRDWGFYAVMELADNEFKSSSCESIDYRPKTLASVIDGEKALPLDECITLGIALAKGLAALQRHHLLHRDIKPGNVLYVKGRPVLSDPGLVVEESEAASLVGTPGYVPPENFTDAAGDVYSLGLTLKAASFGRRVEDLDKGPSPEADTGAKFFNAWWRVLNKATDPTSSRRYQSAKALLKDLESLRRKIALASIVGSRAAKVAALLVALGIVFAIVFAVVASRHATKEISSLSKENKALNDRIGKQAAESKAGVAAIYERALRENFGGILSEERIKEEAQKAVAGEKTGLTPEESKAFRKKIGLDKLLKDLNDSTDRLTDIIKDAGK